MFRLACAFFFTKLTTRGTSRLLRTHKTDIALGREVSRIFHINKMLSSWTQAENGQKQVFELAGIALCGFQDWDSTSQSHYHLSGRFSPLTNEIRSYDRS